MSQCYICGEEYTRQLTDVFEQESSKWCRNDFVIVSNFSLGFQIGDHNSLVNMSHADLMRVQDANLPVVYRQIEKQISSIVIDGTVHEKFLNDLFELVNEVFEYVIYSRKDCYYKHQHHHQSPKGESNFETICMVGFHRLQATLHVLGQIRKSPDLVEEQILDTGFTTRGDPEEEQPLEEEKAAREDLLYRPHVISPEFSGSMERPPAPFVHSNMSPWGFDDRPPQLYPTHHLGDVYECDDTASTTSTRTSVIAAGLRGEYDYSAPLRPPMDVDEVETKEEDVHSPPNPPNFISQQPKRSRRGRRPRGPRRPKQSDGVRGRNRRRRQKKRRRPTPSPILTPPSSPDAMRSDLFVHQEDEDEFESALWRPPRHLFVSGLECGETTEDLDQTLSRFGRIDSIHMKSSGTAACVDFVSNASGIKCLNEKVKLPFLIHRLESKNSSRRSIRKPVRPSLPRRRPPKKASVVQPYTQQMTKWLDEHELSACRSALLAHGYDSICAMMEGLRRMEDVRGLGLPRSLQRLLWSVIASSRYEDGSFELDSASKTPHCVQTMSIAVQLPGGARTTFDVRLDDTVGRLKRLLDVQFGIGMCRLFFCGRELDNDDWLVHHNISEESTLLCSPAFVRDVDQ